MKLNLGAKHPKIFEEDQRLLFLGVITIYEQKQFTVVVYVQTKLPLFRLTANENALNT